MLLVESWLTSSVEDRESFSCRDDMGCTEHSSSCSTEIDDPLYLRRLSPGIPRGSEKESSHLFCMMWIAWWLWSQCKANWPHLNMILGTPRNFAFLGCHQCSSRLVTGLLGTLWSSINKSWLVMCLIGKSNCSGHSGGESGLISRRAESLMAFLELRQETGVYSRVTAGRSIRNWSLFSEVSTLSRYEGQLRNVN